MDYISDKCNICKTLLNNKINENSYSYTFSNELCKYEVGLVNPNFYMKLELLCDYYIINGHIYINKCCYQSIIGYLREMGSYNEIFIISDFSNYIRIKLLNEYKFEIAGRFFGSDYFKINYLGKKHILSNNNIDEITIKLEDYNELISKSIYQEEYENILNILSEKDDEIKYLKTNIKDCIELEQEIYKNNSKESIKFLKIENNIPLRIIINNYIYDIIKCCHCDKIIEKLEKRIKQNKQYYCFDCNNKQEIINTFNNKFIEFGPEIMNDLINKQEIIDNLENEINYLKSKYEKKVEIDYEMIKQKNKLLNTEFKRVAKLMRLISKE